MMGLFSALSEKNPVGGLAGLVMGTGGGLQGALNNSLYNQMAKASGKGNLLGQLLLGGGEGTLPVMPIFGQPAGFAPEKSSGLAEDMLMPNGDVVPVFNQGTML